MQTNRWLYRLLSWVAAGSLLCFPRETEQYLPAAVLAADDFYTTPQINSQGNFLTNAGPVQGAMSAGRAQPGALWRIVALRLNCRQHPDGNAKVLLTFVQGHVVQADLGRGGSDEVLYNARDRGGRTWMKVRSQQGQAHNCYIRAHRQYIQPVLRGDR